MTKQEAIIKGLMVWMGAYGVKEADMVRAGIELFNYLDSQGVVVKVERELPEDPHNFTDRERRLHFYECTPSCHAAEHEALKEAGYAPVEPLVVSVVELLIEEVIS